MAEVVRRQAVQELLARMPVTVARAVRPLAVLVLVTWPTAVAQAAHALERQPEPLAAVAGRPALLALRALPLLLAGCLGKAAVVAAVALLARAVLAALEVAALAAAVVAQHAVHTPLALVA